MKTITDLFSGKALCALLLWFIAPQVIAMTPSSTIKNMISHSQALSQAPVLPRAQILRSSRLSQVTLSPNGELLVYATRIGDRERRLTQYWLYDIAKQSHKKLFISREIEDISWSASSQVLFMKMNNGIAASYLKSDTAPVQLVSLDPQKRERWLGIDYFDTNSFYFRAWNVVDERFEITRMNAEGKATIIYQTTEDYDDFQIDANSGNAILASKLNTEPGNQGETLIFDLRQQHPREIWRCQWDETCSALAYQPKAGTLMLASNQFNDLTQLISVDLATNQHKVLHQDPLNIADVSHIALARGKKQEWKPALINYHGDQHNVYAVSHSLTPHLTAIKHALGDYGLMIDLPIDESAAHKQHWLITHLSNDHAQPRYYLYHANKQQLTPIFDNIASDLHKHEPLMPQNAIAPKFAVRYPARDGFALQGYVTLPRGADLRTSPMVVSVHGGPWSRIMDGFDRRTQHLVNRGYIVFQPNFRASTGFGKAYLTGTKNDFGDGTTQNDIIDGVHFLIQQGIGDKNRLAIVGHSFGGFSTLAGLTFTPDLFQVGFAGAPPTTMGRSAKYYFRFKEKVRRTHNDYFMKQLVVDWDDNTAFEALHERSPDKHYAQLSKPLVIWAGQHDRRVFITDVQDYALRLKEKNKSITLFVDPKAMHSPRSRLGARAYAYLQEKTLAKYLGGALEPLNLPNDNALVRFINRNIKLDTNQLIE